MNSLSLSLLLLLAPACFASSDDLLTVPDLNGDGVLEIARTSPDDCGSGGCTYLIQLSKDGRHVPAGEVYGRPEKLSTRHNGVYDVRAFHGAGCAGLAGGVHFYEFDGKEFQENESRYVACECDDDSSRPAACPQ